MPVPGRIHCMSADLENRTGLTAVVLGGTGLVGEQLVSQLLDDPMYDHVICLGRRASRISHKKFVEHAVR